MVTTGLAFVLAAITCAIVTPLIRDAAIRRGFLDHAVTSRKIHGRPVPRLGGLAIVVAFFAPLLGLLFVDSGVGRMFRADPRHVVGLFAGGLAIAALGVYDDVRGADAWKKLSVQLGVGLLMYALGYRIDEIASPFGPNLQLGLLGIPFTVLWFAGVINAMNLIDGLDGLAGGVAFIGVASTFAASALGGDPLMMLFAAALAGAVLGFLVYNFNPASIFMGDTGSMFLGFVLAASAVQTNQKSSTAVAMLAPVVALGLPIGDTLIAMVRRTLRGRPMFQADREHIHHLLLAKGFSHRGACLVLYAVAAVLGAAAVALSRVATGWTALAVLAPLVGGAVLFLRWLGFVRLDKVPEVVEMRKRNLALRSSVRAVAQSLRRAAEPQDVWRAVRDFGPALDAHCVCVTLPQLQGRDGKARTYSSGCRSSNADMFCGRFGITAERLEEASVEFGWKDRSSIDRDTEIAIEALCGHVADAMARMDANGGAAARTVIPLRREA